MPFCISCGTENPGIAKFCLACGTPLATAPPPPAPAEEERKPITALFVDIVGSTSRAEGLDPEDVLALLDPYYARLRAVLERHGGTVEKFIGDAVVALFGAPLAHEDDPERAVRSGLAILDEIAALNVEDPDSRLSVRIGIVTGEVIVALGAKVAEGQGMAWGDAMNTAARVQSAAPVGGVLVDERTYRASRHAITFEEHEPITAKGKTEPVPVWVATGIDATAGRAAADGPFVGRGAELERLGALWDGVRASGAGRAVIVGEPGIGKSRLVTEALARMGADAVYQGRCLSYGEGITYWPIAEVIRDAAGISAGDHPADVAAKLEALLGSLPTDNLDELRTIAAAVANLVGAAVTPRGTYVVTELSQAELHWGVRRIFELLTSDRPSVLVFEDVHWAEPTLVELLESLSTVRSPLLVVATARREIRERAPALLHEDDCTVVIELDALDASESSALAGELLVAAGIDPAAVRPLLENAGGNPLFLEESARMLVDAARLGQPIDVETMQVPSNVQALIGARLDALPASEKRLGQRTAVAGSIFWSGAAKALSASTDDPDPLLEALAEREVVRGHETTTVAGEREWEFRHALIRDVAYGRLPKRRRVGLHVLFADWLEAAAGAETEFVEIAAYHLEQACLLAREVGRLDAPPPVDRAVAALQQAGEKAESREGVREAHRYYERALELAPEEAEEMRLELRLRLARTLIGIGELQRGAEELQRVADAAAAGRRPDLRCDALIWLANVAGKRGEAREVTIYVQQAQALAAMLGDPRLMIRAGYEGAQWESWFGKSVDGPVENIRASLLLAEGAGDLALQIEGNMRLGVLLFNSARLPDAREPFERCLALAREMGSVRYSARATYALGTLRRYAGDSDEAGLLQLQARDWLERTGDTFFQIQNLHALASIALEVGKLDAAEAYLQQAMPLATGFGGYWVGAICCTLADTLTRQHRLEDAQRVAEMAVGAALAEDPLATAVASWTQAIVAGAEGDVERAAALYGTSIRLFEDNEAWIDLGEVRVGYSQALRAAGRISEALEELLRARETFERVAAAGPLASVEATLRELTGDAAASA